jgi:hypothetical protein
MAVHYSSLTLKDVKRITESRRYRRLACDTMRNKGCSTAFRTLITTCLVTRCSSQHQLPTLLSVHEGTKLHNLFPFIFHFLQCCSN